MNSVPFNRFISTFYGPSIFSVHLNLLVFHWCIYLLLKFWMCDVQSGCCKPSNDCNFEYVSPTNWSSTANSSYTNPDCYSWRNEQNILCYNCKSCKAGLIDNIKSDWKKVAIINIIFIVFLIIVYTVGCCAFRNNRADNSWKRYPWSPSAFSSRGYTLPFSYVFYQTAPFFWYIYMVCICIYTLCCTASLLTILDYKCIYLEVNFTLYYHFFF